MHLQWQHLWKKTSLLCEKEGKLKDATPSVPWAVDPTAAVPAVPAIPPFPSMYPTPQTIPITTINHTLAISNNVSIIKQATVDNLSISNEYDEEAKIGGWWLWFIEHYFNNANENNIAKNDVFSPSTKKSKITDTNDTSPNQKGQHCTREEDIVLCRSFINLSKNSTEDPEKNGSILGRSE